MSTHPRLGKELRREKRRLLGAMLQLTYQIPSDFSAEKILELLTEREALMEQVSAIDAQLLQLEVPVAEAEDEEELRQCLNALVALNRRLLSQASARHTALFETLLHRQD